MKRTSVTREISNMITKAATAVLGAESGRCGLFLKEVSGDLGVSLLLEGRSEARADMHPGAQLSSASYGCPRVAQSARVSSPRGSSTSEGALPKHHGTLLFPRSPRAAHSSHWAV
jgi:hypothetical protein